MKTRYFVFCLLITAFAVSGCGKKNESADALPTADAQGADHDHAEGVDINAGTSPEGTTAHTPENADRAAALNPILTRSLRNDPGPTDEIAVVRTNMGTFTFRLYPNQAKRTVSNFKGLAAKGYYNGTTFHRVIDSFMIQGGDPTGSGSGGQSLWGAEFEDEFDPALRFSKPGIVAMANAGPRTNGSQFFITVSAQPQLNDKHTIFGEILEGMDVVRAIAKSTTDAYDKPLTPVVMESVTIEIRGS